MKSDGGNVQKFLEYLATQQDVRCWRMNSGKVAVANRIGLPATRMVQLGPDGIGDICGVLQHRRLRWGLYFELEAKRPGGKARPTQVTRQAELERMNVPYCVADELGDVVRFLEELRES